MRSSAALSISALIVALLSGCVTPPERRDPFESLASMNHAYKNLTLGLVLSENTKQTRKYIEEYARMRSAIPEQGAAAFSILEDISENLQSSFGSVSKLEKEDAATGKPDVIGTLDVYVHLPNLKWEDATVEIKLILLAPDGKQIDLIQAAGISEGSAWAFEASNFSARIRAATAQARSQFVAALRSSGRLTALAKAKGDGIVAAVRQEGLNELATTTLSETDRLSVNDPRGVRVIGKPPADYVSERFGKSWAVVIGIDDYEKAPRLKYAAADARAMADALRQQGFQVAELYNKQATKAAIERELSDKLVDRVGEQDRVVIFYAGHGDTKTVKGGKTMGYLLPVEGQQAALGETSVSMGRIKELADALPSKQVLFLVDVCYGGIAGNQFRSTLPAMTVAYLKQITRERGRQLITAGGPDQQALESPEWGHSVFTYYLLEGLKGLADLNDDGIIPASELYSYLDSRVFTAAQMKGHVQRPELWSLAAEKGEFVFIPTKPTAGKLTTSPGIEAPK